MGRYYLCQLYNAEVVCFLRCLHIFISQYYKILKSCNCCQGMFKTKILKLTNLLPIDAFFSLFSREASFLYYIFHEKSLVLELLKCINNCQSVVIFKKTENKNKCTAQELGDWSCSYFLSLKSTMLAFKVILVLLPRILFFILLWDIIIFS